MEGYSNIVRPLSLCSSLDLLWILSSQFVVQTNTLLFFWGIFFLLFL